MLVAISAFPELEIGTGGVVVPSDKFARYDTPGR